MKVKMETKNALKKSKISDHSMTSKRKIETKRGMNIELYQITTKVHN